MKIGIMGGTFDPIHIGHLLLGEYAYETVALDKVWFMPNGNPPHKQKDLMITCLNHRIEMTKCAIEQTKHFELALYETQQMDVFYSYATMESLAFKYPQHEFYFILGADSLFAIEHWKNPQRLFKTCTILAALRDDKGVGEMEEQIKYLKRKYNAKIQLLSIPVLGISSSTIRNRIYHGRSIRYMVPESVYNYIKKYKLYIECE